MKIYSVEFMQYTNYDRDTVSTFNGYGNPLDQKIDYLHVGHEPFLVPENKLEHYRQYGMGYRSINFVGNMEL